MSTPRKESEVCPAAATVYSGGEGRLLGRAKGRELRRSAQRRPPRREPPLPLRFLAPGRLLGRDPVWAGLTLRPREPPPPPAAPLPDPPPLDAAPPAPAPPGATVPLPAADESVPGDCLPDLSEEVCRTWVRRVGASRSGGGCLPFCRLVRPPPGPGDPAAGGAGGTCIPKGGGGAA